MAKWNRDVYRIAKHSTIGLACRDNTGWTQQIDGKAISDRPILCGRNSYVQEIVLNPEAAVQYHHRK